MFLLSSSVKVAVPTSHRIQIKHWVSFALPRPLNIKEVRLSIASNYLAASQASQNLLTEIVQGGDRIGPLSRVYNSGRVPILSNGEAKASSG